MFPNILLLLFIQLWLALAGSSNVASDHSDHAEVADPSTTTPNTKDIWDYLIPFGKQMNPLVFKEFKFNYMMGQPKPKGIYELMRLYPDLISRFLSTQDFAVLDCMDDVFRQALKNQDLRMIQAFIESPNLVNWDPLRPDPVAHRFLIHIEEFAWIIHETLIGDSGPITLRFEPGKTLPLLSKEDWRFYFFLFKEIFTKPYGGGSAIN